MHSIVLPKEGPKPSYYNAYIGYLSRIFRDCGIECGFQGIAQGTKFIAQINGKEAVFDFSDHPDIRYDWLHLPYFKFHYSKDRFKEFENIHPFAPISFYNWDQFRQLKKQIVYKCKGLVLNMQEAKCNAFERRTKVQKMLLEKYDSDLVTEWKKPQVEYWRMINKCLVHVFVPGARNDMIDRGHIQYLALGCCTISPLITDELPYNNKLISSIHYIQCKSDYSDLIEKVEWCKKNQATCVEIGKNACKLFEETSVPEKLWGWIIECLNKKLQPSQ